MSRRAIVAARAPVPHQPLETDADRADRLEAKAAALEHDLRQAQALVEALRDELAAARAKATPRAPTDVEILAALRTALTDTSPVRVRASPTRAAKAASSSV